MEKETISVVECAKRLGKSQYFIKNAIQQGVFPGTCAIGENGHRSFVIPRKAFEDYMTKWSPTPSAKLIELLALEVSNKKSRH